MMLRDDEIAKLKLKSQYEDDDWVIPAFVMKGKEMSLPKVNGRAVMENEKHEREMEFTDNHYNNAVLDAGGSRSTGDSDSDHDQYKNKLGRTAKDTTSSGFANTKTSMNQH